jgi:hypothetical protein
VEWLERVGEEESNLRAAHEWFPEQHPSSASDLALLPGDYG